MSVAIIWTFTATDIMTINPIPLIHQSDVIEEIGTTIYPTSPEEYNEQTFFDTNNINRLNILNNLYPGHTGYLEESIGIPSEYQQFSKFKRQYDLQIRLEKRHYRKETCCQHYHKRSDIVKVYYTKSVNPCSCPDCQKCNPSKISKFKQQIYNRHGNIIYVTSLNQTKINNTDDIDSLFSLLPKLKKQLVTQLTTQLAQEPLSIDIIITSNGIMCISNSPLNIPNHTQIPIFLESQQFNDIATNTVYFPISQDLADYIFLNYNNKKKVYHMTSNKHKPFNTPEHKIATCKVVDINNPDNNTNTTNYAQTLYREEVIIDENTTTDDPILEYPEPEYLPVDNPLIKFGTHTGEYIKLHDFATNINNPTSELCQQRYIHDWVSYFGRGKRSTNLLAKCLKISPKDKTFVNLKLLISTFGSVMSVQTVQQSIQT